MHPRAKLLGLFAIVTALLMLGLSGTAQGPSPALAAHQESLTIEVDTDPESNNEFFEFSITGTANCSPSAIVLEDDEAQTLSCSAGTVRVFVDEEAGWELNLISCSVTNEGDTAGVQSTISDTDVGDNDVDLNITDDEHVHCLFNFVPDVEFFTPTPTSTPFFTPTPIIQVPALISISAPTVVPCGGSTLVTVFVRDAFGNAVINGTPVVFNTTVGVLSSFIAATSGGTAQVLFTAPSTSSGIAVVRATSGAVIAATTIQFTCPSAPVVVAPAAPPAVVVVTATPRPVATVVALPRTGEGPPPSSSDNTGLLAAVGLLALAGVGLIGYWRITSTRK